MKMNTNMRTRIKENNKRIKLGIKTRAQVRTRMRITKS